MNDTSDESDLDDNDIPTDFEIDDHVLVSFDGKITEVDVVEDEVTTTFMRRA